MNLRRKVIRNFTYIALGVICIMSYFTWNLTVDRAVSLENKYMLQNLNRANKALDQEIKGMVTTLVDYAYWDDTYSFVQDHNKEYLKSNYEDSTFINNRINMVFILDNEGNIIYEKGYDYQKKHELTIPNQLRSHLTRDNVLLRDTTLDNPINGFIRLDEGCMLIGASPIIPNSLKGPRVGTLVMGRYFDEFIISGLQDKTQVQLMFMDYQNWSSMKLDPDQDNIVDDLTRIDIINERLIAGYKIIKDIYQDPVLLLKVEQTREIYHDSKKNTTYLLLLTMIIGVIVGAIIRYQLGKILLIPLSKISSWLDILGSKKDLSSRLPDLGMYEIANLTKSINSMLDEIEISHKELQESEQRFKYLSYHDSLTGLYNRTFFEQFIEDIYTNYSLYLPLSIISADVDGLKFINDTLGHQKGDNLLKEASRILTRVIEPEEVIARIGGDEFCLILPKTNYQQAMIHKNKIMEQLNKYNESEPVIPISISVGVATSETGHTNVYELFQQADDSMYNYKLSQNDSPKSKIIDLLLAALSERDFIAQGHVQRLVIMAEKMAERLQISDENRRNLILLAKVHDLGKVGISDEILFKREKLSQEEYIKMKEHSRIGFSIANRSKELSHIAGLILYHHEYWNGSGYPIGLKEEEIPLECRILAILDAFDAMTNDRPYHSGISIETARKELVRCSGTQFEPRLVEDFLKLLDEEQGNLVS